MKTIIDVGLGIGIAGFALAALRHISLNWRKAVAYGVVAAILAYVVSQYGKWLHT